MSFMNWKGRLASGVLVLGAVALGGACSSSSGDNSGAPDASPEAQHITVLRGDASPETGTTTTTDAGPGYGTTGQACTTTADCAQNQCSNDMFFTNGPIDPTPVCLEPMFCDLGTDPGFLQFCDSADPTDPNSPGVCLPLGSMTTGVAGECFPKCLVPDDGSLPVGCQGLDACQIVAFGTDQTGAPLGLGVCFGGCSKDADCPTGSQCQADEGLCKTTVSTASKTIGQACSTADGADATFACNCNANQTTGLGFCSSFCIVGANSPSPCPTGYVCDGDLPTTLTDATGATTPGFTQQNAGLAGLCLPKCTMSPTDAAGSCAIGTCQTDAAGSVCVP